jgi:hypothetical protein
VTNSKAVLLFCGMDFSEHAIKQQMWLNFDSDYSLLTKQYNCIGTHLCFHMESNWSPFQFHKPNRSLIDLYAINMLQLRKANACNN